MSDDKPTVIVVGSPGALPPAVTDRVNVGTIGHIAVGEPEPVRYKALSGVSVRDIERRFIYEHPRRHRKKGRNRRQW